MSSVHSWLVDFNSESVDLVERNILQKDKFSEDISTNRWLIKKWLIFTLFGRFSIAPTELVI